MARWARRNKRRLNNYNWAFMLSGRQQPTPAAADCAQVEQGTSEAAAAIADGGEGAAKSLEPAPSRPVGP